MPIFINQISENIDIDALLEEDKSDQESYRLLVDIIDTGVGISISD